MFIFKTFYLFIKQKANLSINKAKWGKEYFVVTLVRFALLYEVSTFV